MNNPEVISRRNESDKLPLVSVIVPTFNRGPFLERCVLSVLRQSYANLECIVMDGSSRDQSLQILRRLAQQDHRLRFVSEPDEGEVFATNKGMDLARGELMSVLASDDFYEKDAVKTSVDFLRQNPGFIGVSGDALYVDDQGRPLNRGVITYRGRMTRNTIRRMLILRYAMCPVYHAAFFGWRQKILAHGKLDPSFSVIPDFEFYLRLIDAGERIGSVRRVQVYYTIHSDMGAIKHRAKVERQRKRLHELYGLRWHHNALRLTLGRLVSYLANPYRSALIPGLHRELRDWWSRTRISPNPKDSKSDT